ncbi:hypothetical protein VP01_697g4 [Puccinia sorghi]|uniref:Anaphase-promoting complex subunit 4 WD40 domain-containing protein n=1 Tax=Puccinia sorghi TaxID=27349 RepID=A0A0L6UG42_9BASI|nr:hypothetical protein VP01_697g4 [Puccinia sorghi]
MLTNIPSILVFPVRRSTAPPFWTNDGTHPLPSSDRDSPLLLTADADGCLSTYQLQLSRTLHPTLQSLGSVSCGKPTDTSGVVMSLSLDISDKKNRGRQVVSSLSNGETVLLSHAQDGSLALRHRWLAHDYEAWTCGFDYWQPDTLLTGVSLSLPNVCVCVCVGLFSFFLFLENRFGGGVTAIRSHEAREHLYAKAERRLIKERGDDDSYDGHVRLFDGRNMGTSVAKEDVGGGVWRLKWHPELPDRLLLACMHAGFLVLDFPLPPLPAKVVSHVSHLASLAYGVDWSSSSNSGHSSLLAGCSFYDKTIHLWSLP